jgi:sirohydrochlorin ferrochelatase
VILVPLLLSSGYHDRVDLPAAVAATRPGTARAAVLGPDPRLAVALADRLAEAGHRPGDAVVLAAAGSSDPDAVASVLVQADLLAAELAAGPATRSRSRWGSAPPPGRTSAPRSRPARAGAHRVAVAPYLLAPGFFADRLAEAGAIWSPPPLGAHPAIAELVVRRASMTD